MLINNDNISNKLTISEEKQIQKSKNFQTICKIQEQLDEIKSNYQSETICQDAHRDNSYTRHRSSSQLSDDYTNRRQNNITQIRTKTPNESSSYKSESLKLELFKLKDKINQLEIEKNELKKEIVYLKSSQGGNKQEIIQNKKNYLNELKEFESYVSENFTQKNNLIEKLLAYNNTLKGKIQKLKDKNQIIIEENKKYHDELINENIALKKEIYNIKTNYQTEISYLKLQLDKYKNSAVSAVTAGNFIGMDDENYSNDTLLKSYSSNKNNNYNYKPRNNNLTYSNSNEHFYCNDN